LWPKSRSSRLDPEDAAALDPDPDHVTYAPLGELTSANSNQRPTDHESRRNPPLEPNLAL
jgi:hypothetical protein